MLSHRDAIPAVRTTVNLQDGVLRRAKQQAERAGKSISEWIEDAIRAQLDQRASKSQKPFRLVTAGSGGLRPGFSFDRLERQVDDLEAARSAGRAKPRK